MSERCKTGYVGMLLTVALLGPIALAGCAARPTTTETGVIRYVALGDSYTIGTGVIEDERWPNQLVASLRQRVPLELVANLGVNGYSSADLIARELPQVAALEPGFVSLLIGVNDVVRGVSREQYRDNVERILDELLEHLPANRVVVVSTPDYTRTPVGRDFGSPLQQQAAIADLNSIMAQAAAVRGIAWVDISPVADQVGSDPTLVAGDGLHPSGTQYARWVDLIAPVVESLLR